MEKKRVLIRLLSVVGICAAVLTVIPNPYSNEISIFGYKAVCPFSPVSTIISLYIAVTAHRYLSTLSKNQ